MERGGVRIDTMLDRRFDPPADRGSVICVVAGGYDALPSAAVAVRVAQRCGARLKSRRRRAVLIDGGSSVYDPRYALGAGVPARRLSSERHDEAELHRAMVHNAASNLSAVVSHAAAGEQLHSVVNTVADRSGAVVLRCDDESPETLSTLDTDALIAVFDPARGNLDRFITYLDTLADLNVARQRIGVIVMAGGRHRTAMRQLARYGPKRMNLIEEWDLGATISPEVEHRFIRGGIGDTADLIAASILGTTRKRPRPWARTPPADIRAPEDTVANLAGVFAEKFTPWSDWTRSDDIALNTWAHCRFAPLDVRYAADTLACLLSERDTVDVDTVNELAEVAATIADVT